MKPIVIYHSNCADGFTAAWCFWDKYKDGVDYHPGVYQQDPPDVTGREVYLVDFSYKRAVVEKMIKVAERVVLIDHHKSALEDLKDLSGLHYYTDLNRSGARLAWDFLNPGVEPPQVLKHVEDRDLWKFEIPFTKEISSYVFSQDYTFEEWETMMRAGDKEVVAMTYIGKSIEKKHMKDVAELLKQVKREMIIDGYQVPVANLPYTMSSEAGNIMAQGFPFAACYMDTSEHRVFSLRSTDAGVDVSEIAKSYGGGGHRNASGFKVSRDHPLARI